MSFAPHTNQDVQQQLRCGLIPTPLPLILGGFTEVEYGHYFEYGERRWPDNSVEPSFPHVLWVGGIHNEARLAKVLKTVAYVLCDDGIQKWPIKNHRDFDTSWVR